MSKLISQLPEDIKAVALQRRQYIIDSLRFAFFWDDTPEGHEIWAEVNNDNYAPFREFHAKQKQPETNGFIQWLENKIELSLNDKDLQREHWAFCQCLKKYRELQPLPEPPKP